MLPLGISHGSPSTRGGALPLVNVEMITEPSGVCQVLPKVWYRPLQTAQVEAVPSGPGVTGSGFSIDVSRYLWGELRWPSAGIGQS